jgi:hypothetical protein
LPVLESLFGLWFVEYHDVESLALVLVVFCHRVGSQVGGPDIIYTNSIFLVKKKRPLGPLLLKVAQFKQWLLRPLVR